MLYRFYGWEQADARDANGLTPCDYYDLLEDIWSAETCAPRMHRRRRRRPRGRQGRCRHRACSQRRRRRRADGGERAVKQTEADIKNESIS